MHKICHIFVVAFSFLVCIQLNITKAIVLDRYCSVQYIVQYTSEISDLCFFFHRPRLAWSVRA